MTYTRLLLTALIAVVMTALPSHAQQLPNNGFEDGWVDCIPWTSNGNTKKQGTTPKFWNVSNTIGTGSQGNTTIAESVTGYNSNSAVKVINKEINVILVKKTIPGYFGLGTSWSTSKGTGSNTDGGQFGGIEFTYRPDAITFMFQSTGSLQPTVVGYLWSGTFIQDNVPANIVVSGNPTTINMADRDRNILGMSTDQGGTITQSGIRIASFNQRIKASTSGWESDTIFFSYDTADDPEKINIIFAAGDYFSQSPTKDNSLTIDDVKLIYYSRLESLSIGGTKIALKDNNYEYIISTTDMPENLNGNDITYTLLGEGQSATVTSSIDKRNKTVTITVTGKDEDSDGKDKHEYKIQYKPFYSRISGVTIGNITYPVGADGKTIDASSLALPMPENNTITANLLSGGQGNPTVDKWSRDTEKGTIAFSVTNSSGKDIDGKNKHDYIIQFPTPIVSRLKNINYEHMQPAFSATTYSYDIEEFTPSIEELRQDFVLFDGSNPTIAISDPETSEDGTKQTIKVILTGDGVDFDGKDSHTYLLTFNMPSTDLRSSLLSALTIKGIKIEDANGNFQPRTFSYSVNEALPSPLTKSDINVAFFSTDAAPADGTDFEISSIDENKAVLRIRVFSNLPDEFGAKQHTYTIQFLPYYSRLKSIAVGEETKIVFDEMDSEIHLDFDSKMPSASKIILTAPEKSSGKVSISEIIQDFETATSTFTVSNEKPDVDGVTSRKYVLYFHPTSPIKLASIAVKGTKITNFSGDKYTYQLKGLLPAETDITVTVDPESGEIEKPTIVLNEADATATIKITDGIQDAVYTLRFEKACPATLEGISVSGKAVTGFSPDKLTYDLEVKSMPSESGITVKLTDSRATAKVAVDTEAKQATITVTSPLAHTEAEEKRVYTLNFTISQSVTPTPTPDDGKTTYGGMLTIMMMGEDLTNGGQEARVEIEDGEEGLCTFRLPDFSLDLGDGPASLGDIVVENVKVTTAPDGARTYEGEVKGMELAEGAIIADVTLTGTADASGKAHMVIKVNWEGIDIDVEFNGQAEEKPEVPVTPAPADGTTIYNGMLTIMMMGEDLTKGGQEARVEIEDGEEGLCTFRLPDFSLDLGDGPASLGDIVVENVKVTTATDGSKTFEGNVEGMELAEGAIIADVTLTGTADSEGMAHMVIKVNWEGIDIDVEFNGQAEEKPEVPVTPTPGDDVWDLTEGIITVEMNGYDITEGGTPATLHMARMDDGKYTFMVPDFMLALDADNTPANLGDIVVNGITASQLSGSLTRYTGTVDNLSLAGGSIAANASIDGTIAADGTTVINVDVEWIMEDGRHVPIMVRFTNTPRSNNTAEDESYSGVMTAEIEGEPIRTFGVLLRISPHSPGRCNMTIEGFDFSPASRAAGLGHTINIPGVCVTPLADGMTGYDGNTSGISVSAGITVDAILHGFTTETGHHSLSLDLLWAEQGVRIAGTFDGHIDVTAIDAPGSDRTDNDENAEWYNMQGIRVNGANLRPGVYIKRTATKTEKIIISE